MIILNWILRSLGTLFALAAVVSLFASPLTISLNDIAQTTGQAGFFLMIAGFIAGWKWELVAGIMILGGYTVFAAVNRILFLNWILALFPIIGVGYLIIGLYKKTHGKTVKRARKY